MTPVFAGWGFKADVSEQAFFSCWQQACEQIEWLDSSKSPLVFSLLNSKLKTSGGMALQRWAKAAFPQVQWLTWDESDIQSIQTASTSARLVKRFGTGSVSEALALRAAAGPNPAYLLLPRIVSSDRSATLAIAAAEQPPYILKTGVLP